MFKRYPSRTHYMPNIFLIITLLCKNTSAAVNDNFVNAQEKDDHDNRLNCVKMDLQYTLIKASFYDAFEVLIDEDTKEFAKRLIDCHNLTITKKDLFITLEELKLNIDPITYEKTQHKILENNMKLVWKLNKICLSINNNQIVNPNVKSNRDDTTAKLLRMNVDFINEQNPVAFLKLLEMELFKLIVQSDNMAMQKNECFPVQGQNDTMANDPFLEYVSGAFVISYPPNFEPDSKKSLTLCCCNCF